MKKFLVFIISIVMCLSFGITAYADGGDIVEPETETTTVDASQPRLMVTSYEVENGSITPNESSTVKVVFKNQSPTKAVKNIKLSLSEDSGDIKPEGMGTQYVSAIYAGSTYTWEVKLTASNTAQIGEHAVTVSTEYEDKDYNSYSSSDTLRINVKQSVSLDYDGATLPAKVVQDETITVDINLMNTGKTDLSNCKIEYNIDGLESGGVTFIGSINAGENKTGSANLRVNSENLGEVKGTITISYDDAYGKTYEENVDVSTNVIEKVVTTTENQEEEKTSKYPLWWVFLITGVVVGGVVGCVIPISINARKQRKEDEMRL
jgi:hypothetical protein